MVVFVLPAYNEELNIGSLVGKIAAVMETDTPARLPYSIVVVDDGSTDRTAAAAARLARRFPVHLVRHEHNAGLAAALRTGLGTALGLCGRHATRGRGAEGRGENGRDSGRSIARGRGDAAGSLDDDVIVTMDCDDTHDPRCVVGMLEAIRGGSDVVIASRYQPDGAEIGLSLSRRVLSRGVNLMLRLAFPTPGVRDFTSGYRAFRASLLQELASASGGRFTECKTFSATADLLLRARRVGARMSEVPLVLRYDRKLGGSKMKVAGTVAEYLLLVARSLGESRFARAPWRRRVM